MFTRKRPRLKICVRLPPPLRFSSASAFRLHPTRCLMEVSTLHVFRIGTDHDMPCFTKNKRGLTKCARVSPRFMSASASLVKPSRYLIEVLSLYVSHRTTAACHVLQRKAAAKKYAPGSLPPRFISAFASRIKPSTQFYILCSYPSTYPVKTRLDVLSTTNKGRGLNYAPGPVSWFTSPSISLVEPSTNPI